MATLCSRCKKYREKVASLNVIPLDELDDKWIFHHNGNLISYVNSGSNIHCRMCYTSLWDYVYVQDGKYKTIYENSEVTVINCSVKHTLYPDESIIIRNDQGLFIMPIEPYDKKKLLFLRGYKIHYQPMGWVNTVYSSFEYTDLLSECNLNQSLFTCFRDGKNNIYLIDSNGNELAYEMLTITEEKSKINDPSSMSWQIFANDKMQVKVWGFYDRAEIMYMDHRTGKHTKAALRLDEESD